MDSRYSLKIVILHYRPIASLKIMWPKTNNHGDNGVFVGCGGSSRPGGGGGGGCGGSSSGPNGGMKLRIIHSYGLHVLSSETWIMHITKIPPKYLEKEELLCKLNT